MDCPSIMSQLAEYQAGALSARRARRVTAHLSACPDCQARLAQLSRLGDLLADASAAEPHNDLWAGIEARWQAASAPSSRPMRLVWAGAAAAAMAILAALVWPRPAAQPLSSEFLGQHQQLAAGGLLSNAAVGDLLTAMERRQ